MNHDSVRLPSIGVAALLLGVLFAALEANESMRQLVLDRMTPASVELPAAVCPADELEEEDLSQAECEQLVADVRSYVVSRPSWFAAVQATLAACGLLLALASIVAGAALIARRGVRFGLAVFIALCAVDAAHFAAAQQTGPILRGIHLSPALLWFSIHGAFALALHAARWPRAATSYAPDPAPRSYGRFEVVGHWLVATSVFFLFVSSWWMLALPLPSADFRYRELPFQLHKNVGITVVLLLLAMAAVRGARRGAHAGASSESPAMRKVRIGGHVSLYALVFAVCITGYLSSSYSGWGTTLWWLVELPYWGREHEELNQLFSDWHLWACWALLVAMAAHIGAALLHAFRGDDVIRRIVRW